MVDVKHGAVNYTHTTSGDGLYQPRSTFGGPFPTTLAKLDNFGIRLRLYYTAVLQNRPVTSHHINRIPSLGARTVPKLRTTGATRGSHQLRNIVRGHSLGTRDGKLFSP